MFSPRLFATWCVYILLQIHLFRKVSIFNVCLVQPRLGWTEEAMIAGSRDVGVSPSIVGSFSRKEAALVEVYLTI